MEPLEQNHLPTADALRAYQAEGAVVLHIPGHGGRAAHPLLEEYTLPGDGEVGPTGMLLADLPSNEYVQQDPDEAGEALAAQAWGADRAWWLLGGASQGNQAAMLGLTGQDDIVLSSRGSHISLVSGLILSGAEVRWIQPGEHPHWEVLQPLGEDELGRSLAELERQGKKARCVVATSPTYFGQVADIPALTRLCHEHGCPLLVDGSWGSHFGFHPGLPANPLGEGADMMLVSTHKHAGSLRGSAILLARKTQWLGEDDHMQISRSLRWLASTSPSFLLRLSLDAARWNQVNHGEELWGGVLEVAEAARERLAQVQMLMIGDQYLPGHEQDRTRLILDISSSGWNGIELGNKLAKDHNIFIELSTSKLLVCMLSHTTNMNDIERLAKALEAELPRPKMGPSLGMIPRLGENVMSPRQAALGQVEQISLAEAEGRVCSEIVSVYPPGIPVLVPGVRIGRLDIDYLQRAAKAGARLYGGIDPSGQSVLVVRN
jgi:lysine decarboxylase